MNDLDSEYPASKNFISFDFLRSIIGTISEKFVYSVSSWKWSSKLKGESLVFSQKYR
jgi:hypothetical protein